MSRSADRLVAAVLTAALIVVGTVSVAPTPAAAEPADTAPVLDIVAPVLDIQFGTTDLRREARVEKRPGRVRVTLDATVLFGKDSAVIRASARGRLSEVAAELKQQGPGALTITGYTDDLGSAQHGLVLSRQRARAVAAVLRSDLPDSAYSYRVEGRGEADPAVPNTSEANRKINRRVVLVFRPA